MTEIKRYPQFQLGKGATLSDITAAEPLVRNGREKPNLSHAVCKSFSKPKAVQHVMVSRHAALGRPNHRADPEPF